MVLIDEELSELIGGVRICVIVDKNTKEFLKELTSKNDAVRLCILRIQEVNIDITFFNAKCHKFVISKRCQRNSYIVLVARELNFEVKFSKSSVISASSWECADTINS